MFKSRRSLLKAAAAGFIYPMFQPTSLEAGTLGMTEQTRQKVDRIASNLLPRIVSVKTQSKSIQEQLTKYQTPGVSVAVIHKG